MNLSTRARTGTETPRNDRVRESFLRCQREEGLALADASDLFDLQPIGGTAPEKYIATYHCRGLVRGQDGRIGAAHRFDVGIRFPADYLHRADTFEVLTWLGPREIWHPNVHDRSPHICIGWMKPGTALVDLVYQVFEVITYNRYTTVEWNALNHDACAWARRNRHRFPIDARPLKRRPEAPEAPTLISRMTGAKKNPGTTGTRVRR